VRVAVVVGSGLIPTLTHSLDGHAGRVEGGGQTSFTRRNKAREADKQLTTSDFLAVGSTIPEPEVASPSSELLHCFLAKSCV
jgi:hypothetical protein